MDNDASAANHAARLEAIAAFGRRLLGVGFSFSIALEAAELVRSHLGVDYADVFELDQDGTFHWKAGAGWPEMAGTTRTEPARNPASEAVRNQRTLCVESLADDDRFTEATWLQQQGVTSMLLVPLVGLQRPLGALGIYSVKRRAFSAGDVAFAETVANLLSASLLQAGAEQRRQTQYFDRAEQMLAIGQVAAGVAHELRNPLTAIKGLVQVNLRRGGTSLPTGDLAVIEHEIRRMERTLQTFLDFARPPQPDRRRVELGAVVDRVLAVVRGRAAKQQVELRWLPPRHSIQIEADQDQLQQLLLNLVLNALDAISTSGVVTVELRSAADGMVDLYVRDTGPGIAPHILPKIFETFVSSKETGLGLGIPMSRRIAEDHGGSLSAYNLPGGGACFLLRLPTQSTNRDRITSGTTGE